jgi:PAS domain S-box-containing protein
MSRDGGNTPRVQDLLAENATLRAKLEEAEETLRAIREGEVDAIIVSGSQGDQVFSLTGTEHVYRLIVETMNEAALTVTTDGRILFCNAQFGAFVQTPPERILGRPLEEFVASNQRALLPTIIAKSQTESVRGRLVFQGAEGPPVPAHVSATALCQADSLSLCLVATDLTELEASTEMLRLLREQQEALAQSEQRYRDLVELSPEAIFVHHGEHYVYANPAAIRLLGAERPEDLVGRKVLDFVHPMHRAAVADRMRQVLEQGVSAPLVERKILRLDGQVVDVEATARGITYEGQPAAQVLYRDITLRKQAQDALLQAHAELEGKVAERTADLAKTVQALQSEVAQRQKAEADLQRTNRVLQMLSACNEALVRLDDEHRLMQEICWIAVEIGGYRMAWVGLADNDADRRVRPVASVGFERGYLESARISWADTERGQGPTGTAIRLGQVQIGTDFLTEPRLAPWRAEAIKRGFRSSIALPLRQGEEVIGALTIYAAEPAAFSEAQVKVLQELAEDLAFGIHAARMRTALRESRDRLRALASELTLTEHRERRRIAQILHDHLQQLLVGAKIRLTVLRRSGDGETNQAAREIEGLVEASLTVSRSLTAELSPPIVNEAGWSPTLEWLARWMADKHGLTVELAVEHDAPVGAGDVRVLLFEAVRELLFNVVKHAQVKTAAVTLRRGPGGEMQIVVADNGVGFDPAMSRSAGAGGSGFGLFSIRERLDLVGGRLEVESTPSQGSRFTLTVPVGNPPVSGSSTAAAEPAPAAATADQGPAPTPDEKIRVLVADDHPIVRRAQARLLSSEPDIQIVGEAATGEQAVELTRQLLPDVVLLDVSMPGMGGVEATRRIRAEFPGVQVIGLSMYDEVEKGHAIRDAGAMAYLNKTGAFETLLAAIRASLQGR